MVDESIRKKPRLEFSLKFEVGGSVGEGTYGYVYLAKNKASGKRVAIKKYVLQSAAESFWLLKKQHCY
jgi:serine/threonine protein kinase